MPVTAKLTATCDNCGAVHDEIKVVNDPDMHIFRFPLVRRPPNPLFDPQDAGENTDADWMMWPDGVTLCAACEATYRAAVKPQEDVRDALIAPLQEQMQRVREEIRTAHRIHPPPDSAGVDGGAGGQRAGAGMSKIKWNDMEAGRAHLRRKHRHRVETYTARHTPGGG